MHIDKPIIIALILLFILILIFVFVAPEYKKFKSLQENLGIKTAEYNAEFDYYSTISQNYAELKSRSDEVKKIDSALPTDPSLGKLTYFFQEQTARSGLILKSLFLTKTSNSANENTLKEITFSLNIVGNYLSLKDFISYIESSAKIFEIKNINFGSQDMSEGAVLQFKSQSVYSFSMQITTYIY